MLVSVQVEGTSLGCVGLTSGRGTSLACVGVYSRNKEAIQEQLVVGGKSMIVLAPTLNELTNQIADRNNFFFMSIDGVKEGRC